MNEITQAQTNSLTSIISIRLPAYTAFHPQAAQQLMVSWFSFKLPFSVGIRATHESIEWLAEVWQELEEPLIRSLYGLYPQAQISFTTKNSAPIGYRLYCFRTVSPFIGPLLTLEEFGQLDPLAGIVSALGTLRPGEVVSYSIHLRPVRPKFYELGNKLLDEFHHEARNAKNAQQVPRFGTRQVQNAVAKLDAALKEAEFAIKVKADTKERANDIVDLLKPGLAVFERDGYNFLIPAHELSYELVLSAPEVAALWHLPCDQCIHPRVRWATGASAPLPQQVGQHDNSVVIGTNLYQGHEQPVTLTYTDRVTHLNIMGSTGVGKSTLLHRLIHQDIAAGKRVGVIDPHGSLVENILATSIPPEREAEVILFDMHDTDHPIGLNLLAASSQVSKEQVAGQALGVIRKMFAENWSSTRMEDALYAALIALMSTEGATIQDILRLFHNSDFRAEVLRRVTDPVALEFWHDEYEPLSASQKHQFSLPIANRIRKFYRDERIRRVVCQQDSLDFGKILTGQTIFLANLGGIAEIDAETLGALLISKFQIAAMSQLPISANGSQDATFYLYIDEVQNFTTTSLSKMFSEARKHGLSLTVANQYLRQLEGDTLDAIVGNAGTAIIFRIGTTDAPRLSTLVKPQFDSEDLLNLSRFNAIVKMQANGETLPAFSLQTAVPLETNPDDGDKINRIRTLSRQRYSRSKESVDAEILARFQGQPASNDQAEGEQEAGYFG
ncbi:MAG: type IV secretion system DNA-binding domain-containing protein [Anaerolineae bacterium]|nr:type IV secretion system DNA-binding domain-containing protein [Anaerolineae bacterium]